MHPNSPHATQLPVLGSTLYTSAVYQSLFCTPAAVVGFGAGNQVSLFTSKDTPDTAYTQWRAPFIQAILPSADTQTLAHALSNEAKRLGCKAVEIKIPSPIYTEHSIWPLDSFFSDEASDLNYHLNLSAATLQEVLPTDQRRVLRKMQDLNWQVRYLQPEEYNAAYRVLARNRTKKNYPITVSLGQLIDAFTAMPDTYLGYGCFANNALLGMAVVLVVQPKVWYTFLLAGDPGAPYSPVMALIDKIYRDARLAGASVLDLGTASVQGVPIPGLAAFKISLGAIETYKRTLRLYL